jgi:23S rRNA pseudouridine1911/1915/1917 synthase
LASTVKNLEILYEDNHLIAVNKRPSDIVQGDKTGDRPLSDVVKLWIKEKYKKPGNVYLGVVHRLDRPVSGVVLFAKTSKALSRMNEQFRSRSVRKVYWAVVSGIPEKSKGEISNSLVKDPSKNKSRVVSESNRQGKPARLTYQLFGRGDNYSFLIVEPHTGRHHQIRVQLASMGCVIKGDLKYGAKRSNRDASIHLHARELHFIHPVTGEPLLIKAPCPVDPLWQEFERLDRKS